MQFPQLPRRVPTWLGSAVLLAVTIFASGLIYSSASYDTIPGNTLQLSAAGRVGSFIAKAKSAIASSTTTTSTTTSSTATSTAPKTASAAANPVPAVKGASVSSSTLAAQALTASGADLLQSVVNIVCLSGNTSIPSISGSGVIIDSRGIILTAAHVAQLFLLQDFLGPDQVTCIIRAGSPARRAYIAQPIYVSPSWIKENPATLEAKTPIGTGQDDFALLAITGTATSTPVPTSFPAIPLAQTDPTLNEQIAIGSYGAQYLTSSELNYSLYPIIVFGSINARYTFDTTTVDLISVDGSAASQEGSSGGGMVDANGDLIGTITTSSVNGNISDRTLNAITVGHMRRSFSDDMNGQSLDAYIANNSLSTLVSNFRNQASILGASIQY